MKFTPIDVVHKIDCGVFPADVIVAYSDTVEDLKEDIGDLIPDEYRNLDVWDREFRGTLSGRTVSLENGQVVIWFKECSPGLISHEAFHATEFILEYFGIRYSEETCEVYAYLIQYITENIFFNLREFKMGGL